MVDSQSKIKKASKQLDFKDIRATYLVSEILRGDTGRFINLKAKVIQVDDVEKVGERGDSVTKRSVQLADETGSVELVLWRQKADNFEFEIDDVLEIESVVASEFNGCKIVSSISETTISKLDEVDMNIAKTPKAPQRHKQNLSCISTHVLAVKDFKCSVVCFSCKKNIDLSPDADMKSLITCSCPAKCMFVIETGVIKNNCSILLPEKQWFSASTPVSILFLYVKYLM